MKQLTNIASKSRRLWMWLFALILSAQVMNVHADKLTDTGNYKVTEHGDHVTFEIMIADLYSSNTWCEWGSIRAYSNSNRTGTVYHLMDVECDDNGDDSKIGWDFYAQTKMKGGRAWLTNPQYGSEKEIVDDPNWDNRSARTKYTMSKGSDDNYLTVKIDYYYPAYMNGKKWYFYYEYKHNGGTIYNMNMGGASCSVSYPDLNYENFKIERQGCDQIKFTAPALPSENNIPAKLRQNRWYDGEYILRFYYTLQDNTQKRYVKQINLEKNEKSHLIDIPAEVGNFKQLDIWLQPAWSVKCEGGGQYSGGGRFIYKSNLFTSIPVPFGLTTEYNQYDNKASLSWNAFPTGDTNYTKETIPYIYRIETNESGTPISGASWSKRGTLIEVGDEQEEGYIDGMLINNKYYKYMVLNVPKAWIGNGVSTSELNNPSDDLLKRLAYCQSDVLATTPSVTLFNLKQDQDVKDKVKLTWEYSRVPVPQKTVRFDVKRRQKGTDNWTDYGNISAPSNPAAGAVATFTDGTLPSNLETFEYKVVLSLNDGVNVFESDVVTAGLLSGSAVTKVEATKGTHESVVRVVWNVRQVGTDNSNFELYRRYAGTSDEFMKIYSVSGTSDSYTYEDNTAQPGYVYEYKVDVYAGAKADYTDNNFQNSMSDVGFCQSRGVISGRVTFGSGSSVEDVRLSLRSSSDNDGNTVRGYSQRVNGASTGIMWNTEDDVTNKLFGKDKSFSLQMFVRPDDNLEEGAVVADIPNYGRLVVGPKQTEGYKLLLERYSQQTRAIYTSKKVWRIYPLAWWMWNQPSSYNEELGIMVWNINDPNYQAYRDSLSHAGYYSVGDGITHNLIENEVGAYFYCKQIDLDAYAHVDDVEWTGSWFDTQLIIPACTYSQVTIQSVNGEPTVIVDGTTSPGLQAYGSAQKYVIGESNLTGDYANFRLTDDGKCLYDCREMPEKLIYEAAERAKTQGAPHPEYWFPENVDEGATIVKNDFTEPFAVGGCNYIAEDRETFKGNITEVRVWDHILTEKEQKSYLDRVITGREKGLALYWPMDEGISNFVFDASYSNDLPNGRHATVGNNIASSTIVPTEAQLSRYGLTNEQGEYAIRGIPFVGSGTTYTVTPTKGIHIFSPSSRNGFVGNGSLALNGYDFTDTSSFPVRGTINYLNTNIPVDSVQFKIDGTLVQGGDKVVTTDSNGEFEISVPIGEHLIECYKEGHRLTSFPLDGSKYDFKEAMTVNFTDSTLVNVTGRINGGFSDQDAPLGFEQSVNRLGKATMKLSLGKESQCSFNYIVDEHGSGEFGTTNLPVESASDKINSTAYRAGGEHDDTYYIYISTDEKTGEYSALLPPLRYKVESIAFDGGNDYNDKSVFSQNLPFIDATNTIDNKMGADTLKVEGQEKQLYKYSAKQNFQYRATPTITVEQVNSKNGAFGEEKVPISTNGLSKEYVTVLNYTDNSYNYVYNYPVFVQEEAYEYYIDIYEHYKNLDTNEEFDEVPSDAIVSIENNASASVSFIADKTTIEGQEYEPGEIYEIPNIRIKPDKLGHVTYQFIGGIPNFGGEHLRSISIGVNIDNRTTMWQAPNSATGSLDLILLGSLMSGNQNFVTSGPSEVDMILRRPPGSTSEAVLITDTLTSTTKIDGYVKNGHSEGGGFHISVGPEITKELNVAAGAVYLEAKHRVILNTEEVWENRYADTGGSENGDSYRVTQEVHGTTEGIQNNGDTYIGRSTNMLFGKGLSLGFYKKDNGDVVLDTRESLVVSQKFGTYFAYPQEYIEETLIPNWQAIIDARLTEGHITADHWVKENLAVVPDKVMYYTIYNKGDEEFGRSNGDDRWDQALSDARNGYPSYRMVDGTKTKDAEDEVDNAIRQIKAWKALIAKNEQEKVEAFERKDLFIQNYSIAGGTSVSITSTNEKVKKERTGTEHEFNFGSDTNIGYYFNELGANAILRFTKNSSETSETETEKTTSSTVQWTLSDGDPRTALSVDVYKSENGWGPIFRTRGGQTANPYEGATYTKYYMEGTKLDEATMQIEKPKLSVNGSVRLSNIPTGGEAKFDLQLFNESETGSACNYVLEAIESSNATGAVLKIDGSVLSMGKTGRMIGMQGGETIHKMLYVSQSDRSINEYEDLQLVLRSEQDDAVHSDTLHLYIEFVPSSAIVEMSVNRTILNLADQIANGGFKVTFTNLDRQDTGLKGVRVQYRRKGNNDWNQIFQWKAKGQPLQQGDVVLPDEESFSTAISFQSDGTYELRGQTFGTYGGEEVTYETAIIEVIQDTRGPKILGMVSPEYGLLTYDGRNNMHVRFNEVLNDNALSKTDNFRIEGNLNNVEVKSQYADVALLLNGDEFHTQARYSLEDTDISFGMWIYRQSDGDILSLGHTSNRLGVYTYDNGKLGVRCGDTHSDYRTEVVLPEKKWNYLALAYTKQTESDPQSRVTLLYANSETTRPVYALENTAVGTIEGESNLIIGGQGMKGMMHDLTLWNNDVTANELYELRNNQQPSYTPGLIGYWRMNEGRGTVVEDDARSRHIILDNESWYINNRNRATQLDGSAALKIDISRANARATDNFAWEMWFRGEDTQENRNATLASVLNSVHLGFDDGELLLSNHQHELLNDGTDIVTVTNEVVLTEQNYCDGNWHHLALNVRRGTSAIVYIDGKAVKTLPESSIPAVTGHYLYVGGEQMLSADGVRNLFCGDVDEIRIWNAALTSDIIDQRRYERLDNTYAGLIGYFPMEEISRQQSGNIESVFSSKNFGDDIAGLTIEGTDKESVNAPALLPGSSRIRLAETEFDFTASSDQIYFSFPENMLPLMDGNTFTASIANIRDEHGNTSEPVNWTFRCSFALLSWEYDEWAIEKKWNETTTMPCSIYNMTSTTAQSYEISGLPTWMTVDQSIGTIDDQAVERTFTILPSAPIGQHVVTVYLTDRLGIKRIMPILVTVKGEEPDWSVDPNLYESNMLVTGQIYMADKISESSDSKIAAFDDMGLCRGVGSPKYVATRDAYYVDMIVYGASSTELSTGERDITFRMYDATTGKNYPVVFVTLPDGTTSTTMRYSSDAILGTYDVPVVFTASNIEQEKVSLPRGWSWMSIYVQPVSTQIADILPKNKSELKKFKNIKSHNAIASVKADGSAILGELTEIVPGNMYKIQVSSTVNFDVLGEVINVLGTKATIYPKYNWIGSLSNSMLSPAEAFADLDPEIGDWVKTRTEFASYRGGGVWEGTLQSIVPGVGYIYYSKANDVKTFNYPRLYSTQSANSKAMVMMESGTNSYYTPVDSHDYPDNMNLIAVVKKDGQESDAAEVAAFVNGECRGAISYNNGYYFLTVMGDAQTDTYSKVEIRVYIEGEEYVVQLMDFISDAMFGSLEEPFVLDIDATAIRDITLDDDADDTEWYTLQGYKLGRKPTLQGVYIHKGNKVTIK